MGNGYCFKCSSCGYEQEVFLGCGMLFPQVFKKVNKEVIEGKYGPEWKELALSQELIAADAYKYLYVCDSCKNWKEDYGLSLYAPNDPEAIKKKRYGIKTVEEWGEVPYVTTWEDYHLLKEYAHKCDKCGCEMRQAPELEVFSLPCPKCGSPSDQSNISTILWD